MPTPVIETDKANLELMSGKTMLHILKDVTFQVMGGEVTAVVGPSGSGKTSLLMILGGLERATTGKVVVAGQDISTANEDQLAIFRRKNLGILFQNFHLIPSMTALENVALALEIAAEAARNPKVAAIVQEADRVKRRVIMELLSKGLAARGKVLTSEELEARLEVVASLFEGLSIRTIRNPGLNRDKTLGTLRRVLQFVFES